MKNKIKTIVTFLMILLFISYLGYIVYASFNVDSNTEFQNKKISELTVGDVQWVFVLWVVSILWRN